MLRTKSKFSTMVNLYKVETYTIADDSAQKYPHTVPWVIVERELIQRESRFLSWIQTRCVLNKILVWINGIVDEHKIAMTSTTNWIHGDDVFCHTRLSSPLHGLVANAIEQKRVYSVVYAHMQKKKYFKFFLRRKRTIEHGRTKMTWWILCAAHKKKRMT